MEEYSKKEGNAMDLGEKIKKRLIIIFVRIPLIIIFIGAFISIPLYFLNIVYHIGNTYVEEKGREPESITAADAPYFKNGKRRQRHWKNHTYEYGVDARVGDIIDPGGNLLSGKVPSKTYGDPSGPIDHHVALSEIKIEHVHRREAKRLIEF